MENELQTRRPCTNRGEASESQGSDSPSFGAGTSKDYDTNLEQGFVAEVSMEFLLNAPISQTVS